MAEHRTDTTRGPGYTTVTTTRGTSSGRGMSFMIGGLVVAVALIGAVLLGFIPGAIAPGSNEVGTPAVTIENNAAPVTDSGPATAPDVTIAPETAPAPEAAPPAPGSN